MQAGYSEGNLWCIYYSLPVETNNYLLIFFSVGFKPFAEMHTAHHMLMFGCQVPAVMAMAKDGKYW